MSCPFLSPPSPSLIADVSDAGSESTITETLHLSSNITGHCHYIKQHSQSQLVSHSNIISIPIKLDPLNSEIQALRQGVTQLEGNKLLLEDYATEVANLLSSHRSMSLCISRFQQLQSRIRQLEQERMDSPSPKDISAQAKPPSMSRLPMTVPTSSSSKPHTSRLPSITLSSKRPLKAAPPLIVNSSKRILLRSTPAPNDEKPISGVKSKLPKRGICDVKDLITSLGSGNLPSMSHRPMSPSRRPAATHSTSKPKTSEKKPDLQPNKSPDSSKLPAPDVRSNKRTLFSSKLDPLALTSKLLPISSSPRTKAYSKPPETPTVSILPATPVSRNGDAVILDSPPNKGTIKPRHVMKTKKKSSTPPNQANDAQAESSTSDDRKTDLHVSFSNPGDELRDEKIDGSSTETGIIESTNKLWGSWNKKRTSLQVPTIHENSDGCSPTPSINSTDGGRRKEKRRSLAPQYIRSLMSGSNESMSDSSNLALRRSNSISGHFVLPRSSESDHIGLEVSSIKKRLNPLLVGSPTLPKARLESDAEVGRVNSLRTPGKWANRSRILSADFTRRRTIHPMFGFERPGSAGAISTVSSQDEQTGATIESDEVKKQRRVTMPAKPIGCSTPGDASGHTAIDGPEPGARGALLRPLLGAQGLGRFDFEASTSTSILPRRIERGSRLWSSTSPTKASSGSIRLSKLDVSGFNKTANPESHDDMRFREYTEFCKELRAMLGDDDWPLFMNYARRFDLHVLSPDVLLQRVKKLIDSRRNVDLVMRTKMYERFSKIVHDSIRD